MSPGGAFAFVLMVALAGCSGGPTSESASPSSPSANTASGNEGTCNPLEFGGPCLGELEAGTYTTTEFSPSITYSVPDGWGNWEDLPGNFLLLPPGEELEGVNADESDFIGIYNGVAAAAASCAEIPQPGVEQSPDALAEWFSRHHPGLDTTDPEPTNVGGLEGMVLDVSVSADWDRRCPFAEAGQLPVPLLIGVGPAGLHHVIKGDATIRLYLLDAAPSNVVIEVVDHPGDDLSLEDYAVIINDLKFQP